ncbi:MAG: hypothetical protein N2Z65_02675 [Clostridiales bacterium]|nr:hypothetical protein [Clostridiales bacterium]
MSNEGKPKLAKNKKFLLGYAIALFSMALILIVMSYLSQMKAENQIQQLNERISTTQGSIKKLETLTELTREQSDKIEELTKELQDAEKKNKELEDKNTEYSLATGETGIYSKTIKAYEYFWQLEKNYRTRYYKKSREIIKLIDSGEFTQFLSEDAAAEYQKIKNALK